MFDVSVCIATYRRPQRLARLLEGLSRQKLAEGPTVEIVVVDNDLDGSAGPIVNSAPVSFPIQYIVEERANVAGARNRGVAAAQGTWIAFLDDDEVPHEGWLAAYWECVQTGDADGWFGPVLPILEAPATPWLDIETFYARCGVLTSGVP